MAAKVIEIANALVGELNGHTFSQAFTAERAYQPTYDLQDMQDLHVTVVPKSRAETPASRIDDRIEYAVDIGVQKKLNAAGDGDELMLLVSEIAAFLNRLRLAAAPDAGWTGTVNEPIFSPEHWEKMRQFTSVLTVSYRARE